MVFVAPCAAADIKKINTMAVSQEMANFLKRKNRINAEIPGLSGDHPGDGFPGSDDGRPSKRGALSRKDIKPYRKGIVLMKIIYEPRGKAREYSPLAANLYKGCGHGCSYCYAPDATFTDKEIFKQARPRPGVINDLEKQAMKDAGDPRPVLLSFTSDPYQPIEEELYLTRTAILMLQQANRPVRILTKGGFRATKDFWLLKKEKPSPWGVFGATLTFLSHPKSQKVEPYAALPHERVLALAEAHHEGISTWVSLEPLLDMDEAIGLIHATASFVDHYMIGKCNHVKMGPDEDTLRAGLTRIIEVLRTYEKAFYIKEDTRPFCIPELRPEETLMIQ